MFDEQKVLPAARKIKDFEKHLESDLTYIILLDMHIAQLKPLVRAADKKGKKVLLHADLIQGLKNDEYAAEFLCQQIKPAGVISTRANVLTKVKREGLIAIQRIFLLDSIALGTSYKTFKKVEPDAIEVLPGIIPKMITEVSDFTGVPVIAGGFIRSEADIDQALDAGAVAVTTSTIHG